jgi:hypothetical protein
MADKTSPTTMQPNPRAWARLPRRLGHTSALKRPGMGIASPPLRRQALTGCSTPVKPHAPQWLKSGNRAFSAAGDAYVDEDVEGGYS